MLKYKTGDLLEASEDIIAHQVNCFGAAGGLAAAVFHKFPQVGRAYSILTKEEKKPEKLLGGVQIIVDSDTFTGVANLFGQYHPGADYRPESLRKALKSLAKYARDNDKSVALPYKISCGICGGDWSEVLKIIEETMTGIDCVIYKRAEDR